MLDQDEMGNICRGSHIHYLHKLNHLDFVKILEVPTNLQQDLHMAIIFVLLDQDEMRFFVGELNKGNKKITELRTILQRESRNS